MLEKISHVVLLKDFYGTLLTKKQQDVLNMHYENDWSLSEIALNMNTSRQAVYDIVRRTENMLEEYEAKLGLVDKFQRTQSKVDELAVLLENANADKDKVDQAVALLKEISGLL